MIAQRGPHHLFSGRKRNRYVKSRNAVFHFRLQNSLRLVAVSGRFMMGCASIPKDLHAQLSKWNKPKWSIRIRPVIPVHPIRISSPPGIRPATNQKRTTPARSLLKAIHHSQNVGRSLAWSGAELRKASAFNPGHANKYPVCCHQGAPCEGVRRQVNHLQPEYIVSASNHMKTQRGHAAGVKSRTAMGNKRIGPQPRQGDIGGPSSFGSTVSVSGGRYSWSVTSPHATGRTPAISSIRRSPTPWICPRGRYCTSLEFSGNRSARAR